MISALKSTLPIFTTVFAVLITNLPFLNKFAYIDLAIPVIFLWIVKRPSSMWFVYIFALGIVADVVSNVTLGMHSFAYLMIWTTYLYFKKQQFTRTMIGINITSVIIIVLSYLYYGALAYLNGSLQIMLLGIGAMFTVLISIILNIILLSKYGR